MKTILLVVIISLMFLLYLPIQMNDRERVDLNTEFRTQISGNFVKLSKGFVHYERTGSSSGPLVIMLHGYSLSSHLWERNASSLSRAGFDVVRYDFYGRGYSDRPDTKHDPKLYIDQLIELRLALGISNKPMHLIGVALGGLVSIQYAAQNPSEVLSLSLIAPDGYGSKIPLIVKPALWPYIGNIYGEYLFQAFLEPIIFSRLLDFGPEKDVSELKAELIKHMKISGYKSSLLSSLLNMPISDAAKDYRQVANHRIPTLLLWGDDDKITSVKIANKILKDIPDAVFIPIKAGHLPQFEMPEEINHILIKFIGKN